MSIHPSGTVEQLVPQFQQLKKMGLTGIRTDFSWTRIEPAGHDPSGSTYNWTQTDAVVAAAEQVGLQVDAILDYGHPLYNGGQDSHVPPTDPQDFADFAADVVDRYGTRLRAVEVWNEQNAGYRFWKPQADPAGYMDLLCATYATVKPVEPTLPVVFGGVFMPPVGNLKTIIMGGADFVDAALTSMGSARCFDVLAYHPYNYPFAAPEIPVAAQGNQSVISYATQLRQILAAHGLGSTPLWNTESGWPSNATANGVSEDVQARYYTRLALLSWQAGVPWVTFYDQYDSSDAATTTDQESHFGFWHYDGTTPEHGKAKPVVAAMTSLTTLLGPDWTYTADVSSKFDMPTGSTTVPGLGRGYALEFTGPGDRHTVALWYANESYSTTCSAGIAAFNCPVMPFLPAAETIGVTRPATLQATNVTRTSMYGVQSTLPVVDTAATTKAEAKLTEATARATRAKTALKEATAKATKATASLKKATTKAKKARGKAAKAKARTARAKAKKVLVKARKAETKAEKALATARKARASAAAGLRTAAAAETTAKTVSVGQDPIFLSWTGPAL